MEDIKKALHDIYIKPIKTNPELFIGVELEFPIVNLSGKETDTHVSKALLTYLSQMDEFAVQQLDSDGYPVQLCHLSSGDLILFEVSYNILEFAFAKTKTIQEIENRFEKYLGLIQPFLQEHNHEIQAHGIHPTWEKNDNSPVKLSRYQMLMQYLALGKDYDCHPFVDYGAFICGNQVQLDVNSDNYLRVLNAFNKIEAAKAYLFPNSPFPEANWETTISRDYFWEESMHGLIPENVGIFQKDFQTEDDYLSYLSQTAMFYVKREDQTYYFPPLTVSDYLSRGEIDAYSLENHRVTITPSLEDLQSHRAYHYQLLTRRGTVEYRSVCAQPLALTFAPVAFHLGLLVNIAELESYLASSDFFHLYGSDYRKLRHQFSKKILSSEEKKSIRDFSLHILEISISGLARRRKNEEKYLEELKTFLFPS